MHKEIAARIADATLAANLHDALNRDGRRAEKHLFDPMVNATSRNSSASNVRVPPTPGIGRSEQHPI